MALLYLCPLKPGLQYDANTDVDADTEDEIEMNPTSASPSASTPKNATSVEVVSLKFDAQLSVSVIL